MKRFFAMVLSLALVLGLVPAVSVAAAPGVCQACGTTPTWEVMPTNWKAKPTGHYHYYLDKDVTPGQLLAGTDIKMDVCLDLNGHSINTDGRAMIAWYGSTINIMDSSANQTGYICGSTGSNNSASGSLAATKNGTIRLYSGTLKFKRDDTGLGVGKGGIMCAESTGTIEILGGRVEGAEMVVSSATLSNNGSGGAIYVYNGGKLTVSGGEITSGTVPASAQGPCVFLEGNNAKMTLTGSGKVGEICNNGNGTNLTISGTYTGKARLKLATGKTAAADTVVATAAGADISGADLFCTNGDGYTVEKSGDNLVLKAFTPTAERHLCEHCNDIAQWKPLTGNAGLFKQAGEHHIYLSADYESSQLNAQLGAKVCLDLYGNDVYTDGRAFHVAADSQLSLMDSVGGSTVTGTSGSNNPTGGTLAVGGSNGVLNVYAGTYRAVQDGTGHGIGAGGIVYMGYGTMNLYGGALEGADLVMTTYSIASDYNGCGAAVCLANSAKLNVYGGTITSGTVPADRMGTCIYLRSANAKVTVSGSGSIDEIYCQAGGKNLTVSGTYTGTVNLRYPDAADITDGTVVGSAAGADISGATIFCTNGDGYFVEQSGNDLVTRPFTASAERHICEHCGSLVTWKPLADNKTLFATAGTHHLYLAEDYNGTQLNAKNGAKVCLDLNGKTIYADGRALHVAANSQLSIMDSVGGGKVIGTTGNNNPTGGTLAVGGTGGICNIYGGTFSLQTDDVGLGVGTGGVLYMSTSGVINMYGGKVLGADLVISGYELTINGYGAAAYIGSTGQLNVYGGEITSGTVPDGGLGKCVYLATSTAKVNLSGDAIVDEIYAQKDSKPLSITGTYTGTANLRYPDTQAILEDMQVGTCTNGDLSGANLRCTNGRGYFLANSSGKLVISSFGLDAVAAAYNSTGAAGYSSLQEAVDACTDGYVQLLKNAEGTTTVTRDLYIDMNGRNATIQAAENVTIYGFDSQTNDYTVADGKYGKLTVTGGKAAGLPETSSFAEDGYLMVNEDGVLSFHRVKLQIYAMSLRGDEAGIYYKSHFLADEKAAAQLERFGIALSVIDTPTERNLETKCVYTTFTGFESGPVGNLGNNSSTLLKGILKDTNDDAKNLRNLDLTVYGRAYAKSADGQLLFGVPVSRSFREQLEAVDTILPGLSQQQVEAASGLYQKFAALLKELKLPNMTAAAQEEEKGTLKVLSLGHSHGLDGTGLLYEVLDAELEEDIVVGALYYSGCRMRQHADFLPANQPVYDYYKKDKTNVDGKWTITKETTCLHALQDEQWDVIVIQDANYDAGTEVAYNVDDYMTVINYLYNNQEDKPRLLFHMTWTNPDDYDTYISSSSGLSHPNLNWYKPYMEERYADENGVYQREIHIKKILDFTEQYLEDCTDFLGEKYIESVIPAATAVEYAQYVCGRPDAEIYRDWTHMNDYGRLIVAYTWYAKIMQLDKIDSVKVTEVPKGAHHSNSKFPADLKFDEQMRADALAAVNFALANPYQDIANDGQ